jgi:hypothetical protein
MIGLGRYLQWYLFFGRIPLPRLPVVMASLDRIEYVQYKRREIARKATGRIKDLI